MPQMIKYGDELIRISPKDNKKIEFSRNNGLTWILRCTNSSVCIGTADIKDLHVKVGNSYEPFLMIVATLLKRRVDVMLIHAKEPGPNLLAGDFKRSTLGNKAVIRFENCKIRQVYGENFAK